MFICIHVYVCIARPNTINNMSVVEANREVRADRAPAAPIDAEARDNLKCSVNRISLPFFETVDCALAASKIWRRLFVLGKAVS